MTAETPNTPELIEHMLKELEHPKVPLSDWEEGFVMSVGDQFERRGSLSDKQFKILEGIYAEKTA